MTESTPASIQLRRAGERFHTSSEWLDSWHSFSFGAHYDPANMAFGPLVANNEDRLAAGHGFEPHPHRDTEIVTWVLSGTLVHRDDHGHHGVVGPGVAQRLSAGTGIVHSEVADSEAVHLVQMWVRPDDRGPAASYEQGEVDEGWRAGRLTPIASGLAAHATTTAVRIHNRNAGLSGAQLQPGQGVELPDAPFVHLFVTGGELQVEGAPDLAAGDALRLTRAGARRVQAVEPAQLLVWQLG